MGRDASQRYNRESIKEVDVLMYSFQLLDSSQGPVGPGVAAGMHEEIGGSVEFGGCDYGTVPTVEAILVNESLLICNLVAQR